MVLFFCWRIDFRECYEVFCLFFVFGGCLILSVFFNVKIILILVGVGVEINECLEYNGGCWENKKVNIIVCKV